nr:retrovirus-related Pol polyprotein from transposon TNT 1-94 [Tanacetum cinerariifolium]
MILTSLQVILVPSFPSNSFSAAIETHRNLVLAAGDPAPSIVSTSGVLIGSVPASGVPAGSLLASSLPASGVPAGSVPASGVPASSLPASGVPAGSVPASGVPAGSLLASSVSAGGVLAGSIDSAEFGVPAASESVPAVFSNDPAATSPLPPGHSLGSCEHTTRFPFPSDLGNHQPTAGIFSSSSYGDDFCVDVTNLALNVAVDPVATKRQVWKLVPLPAGKIAIGTKWILKNKRDVRGIVVFSPVARIEAIRLFLAFASYMDFMVYQMDVKSAFLYEEIEEKVYVTQPKGFEDPHNPKHVYRVVKALYGLYQALRAWYTRLSTFLLKHHYRRGTIDKTLFLKKDSRHIILVQVYVDDIIFGSKNKAWCDEFEVLMKGEFEMSSMGDLTFFLGLQVKQLPDGNFISQDKYVKDMLKKFDMESVRTATTPYEVPKHKSMVDPDDAVNVHLFRSMIGSLMYLTASRPDIMFAVSACSRHQVTPLTSHLNAVKKIFKYLKGQPNLGLWYSRDSPFQLEAYSDSDYAGSHGDRKSTIGTLDPEPNVRLWVQLHAHQ